MSKTKKTSDYGDALYRSHALNCDGAFPCACGANARDAVALGVLTEAAMTDRQKTEYRLHVKRFGEVKVKP